MWTATPLPLSLSDVARRPGLTPPLGQEFSDLPPPHPYKPGKGPLVRSIQSSRIITRRRSQARAHPAGHRVPRGPEVGARFQNGLPFACGPPGVEGEYVTGCAESPQRP